MKEYKDMLRKGFLLGLGAASLTSKKVNEVVKDLTKKGKLNAKEGEELVGKILKDADAERKRVQKFVMAEMKRYAGPAKKKTVKKAAKKKPAKKSKR
ncbi:MAG: hypothetical protein KJ601_02910 [Nanoarchaeota archaeon]|nr:hypothetical protein [Nanoarchaeota archaeon]MBU1704017.1 hypothetical protein [Nanoarchaeota archaeon]